MPPAFNLSHDQTLQLIFLKEVLTMLPRSLGLSARASGWSSTPSTSCEISTPPSVGYTDGWVGSFFLLDIPVEGNVELHQECPP
jgi:hypothetical protein